MISRSNILTAAHCVKDVNADQIHVVLGDVNYTVGILQSISQIWAS